MQQNDSFETEIKTGHRFEFGRNWQRFLAVVDSERVDEAARSLRQMLQVDRLDGRTVLDVGSGSGLFSLAAVRLGARRVHSFDFDPQSVECTRELKRRFAPDAAHWSVERGSILDEMYTSRLGIWDVVYSWGVLHHTGSMWTALARVSDLVLPGGELFIAIYNDQGIASRWWARIKRLYNTGMPGRAVVCAAYVPYFALGGAVADIIAHRNPLARYTESGRRRGMSVVHDWIDWLGGYPFEVAKPEQILDFFLARGYQLQRLTTCAGRLGCNEFVFRKTTRPAA
jgi:2-polyprenyl-3-methyl-5-hydroxy-6-metoxy-1,4-benzoquinol methylase